MRVGRRIMGRQVWMGIVGLVLVAAACHNSHAAKQQSAAAKTKPDKIKVVVVTGGHAFEHKAFFSIFDQFLDEMVFVEARQKDHSEIFERIDNWDYDVIVFYNMTQNISPKRQQNFLRLLKRGVGVVALHHCMGSFQQWPQYRKIIGGRYNLKAQGQQRASTYKHDLKMKIHIADRRHPITRGLEDFEIHDEAYKYCSFEPDNHVLLVTDHPDSDKTVGWVRSYGRARICTIQLGHGPEAYANPNYRTLIGRAIRWSAGRLR